MPAWMRDTANKDVSQILREMEAETKAAAGAQGRGYTKPIAISDDSPEQTFVTPHFQLKGESAR